MVTREGEEKKSAGDDLYNEDSNRGGTKKKGYQGKGKSQMRGDLSKKECYYCKKKRDIQMLYKEMQLEGIGEVIIETRGD